MLRLVLGNVILIFISSYMALLHVSSEETMLKATTAEVFQHQKAIGATRSIGKVVSIVGCNLRCLQDELCEATNFLMGFEENYCELLAASQIAGLSFVSQENATFTSLKRISHEVGIFDQCRTSGWREWEIKLLLKFFFWKQTECQTERSTALLCYWFSSQSSDISILFTSFELFYFLYPFVNPILFSFEHTTLMSVRCKALRSYYAAPCPTMFLIFLDTH